MYRRKLAHSPVKNLFRFASRKNNCMLTVESSLEFDACFHWEYSPMVERFEAQPEGFFYTFDNYQCGYTPDFAVIENGERRFIEVKPQSKISRSDFRDRFHMKQAEAKARGIELMLVTDKQIRAAPLLSNLKLLHRYCSFQSVTSLHQSLLELISQSGTTTIYKLVEVTGENSGIVIATILSLVASGKISMDLTQSEIGIESEVWCEL